MLKKYVSHQLPKICRRFSASSAGTSNKQGWPIKIINNVAVVYIDSNKANVMNYKFFGEAQETLTRLETEKEYQNKAVIFTSKQDKMFSAGLNLKEVYPMNKQQLLDFVSGKGGLCEHFLNLIKFRRPTVAAINGHCIAGGMIFALSCDFRVAATGNYKIGLSEVPVVGIPFPAVPFELCRAKLDASTLVNATMRGKMYLPTEALEARIVDRLVEPSALVDEALQILNEIPPDSFHSYAIAKDTFYKPFYECLTDSYKNELDKKWVEARFATGGEKLMGTLYKSLTSRG